MEFTIFSLLHAKKNRENWCHWWKLIKVQKYRKHQAFQKFLYRRCPAITYLNVSRKNETCNKGSLAGFSKSDFVRIGGISANARNVFIFLFMRHRDGAERRGKMNSLRTMYWNFAGFYWIESRLSPISTVVATQHVDRYNPLRLFIAFTATNMSCVYSDRQWHLSGGWALRANKHRRVKHPGR